MFANSYKKEMDINGKIIATIDVKSREEGISIAADYVTKHQPHPDQLFTYKITMAKPQKLIMTYFTYEFIQTYKGREIIASIRKSIYDKRIKRLKAENNKYKKSR